MANSVTTVSLNESSEWKSISPLLESDIGGYAKFMFHYVMIRNSIQQVGEMDINDNGLQVQFDHEWTVVPSGQTPQVEFDVSHYNGKRVLRYRTTGSGGLTFKFQIDHRIA